MDERFSQIDAGNPKQFWDAAIGAIESGQANVFWEAWKQMDSELQKEVAKNLKAANSPDFEKEMLSKLGNFDDETLPIEKENRYIGLGELGATDRGVDVAAADILETATRSDEECGPVAAKAIFSKAMRAWARKDNELTEDLTGRLLDISKSCPDDRAVAALEDISALAEGSPELVEIIRNVLQELIGSENKKVSLASIDELIELTPDQGQKRTLVQKKLGKFDWEVADKESFPAQKMRLAQQLNGLTADFPEATARLTEDANDLVRTEIQISQGIYQKR